MATVSTDLFPFEILEIPAAGSYATLCIARAANGELVACKVLKKGFVSNAEALTRMRDEARMLSRLDHPGIVNVHDLLNLDCRPVMVMEWVRGLDLSTLVHSNPTGLPADISAEIIRQSAAALDAAYNSPISEEGRPLQVIHRDIKPENIMLSGDGVVKLLDFGTAKGEFEDREARTVAIVRGSRGFMAPERMDGDPDTPAVDVYALGLTFFQLLTGKPAVISLHYKRHDNDVRKALEHFTTDDLSADSLIMLRHLVRRMCLYEPEERPSHAEVVADIEAVLGDHAPDLIRFAAAHVRPVHDQRERRAPESHPEYHDLTFLGTAGSWDTLSNPDITEEMSDDRLRDFLRNPGWEARVPELQLLLTQSARWTSHPFMEVLHKAHVPWWQIWASRPNAIAIATALEFLRQRKGEKQVITFATKFVDHADKRVRKAARAIVEV